MLYYKNFSQENNFVEEENNINQKKFKVFSPSFIIKQFNNNWKALNVIDVAK